MTETSAVTEPIAECPAGSKHAAVFRAVAIAEAISWTGLLVGMLFKYVLSDNEIGVKIFGPVHGMVFIAYVITVLAVRKPLRWGIPVTLLALAASIPPLFTWFFELWVQRTNRHCGRSPRRACEGGGSSPCSPRSDPRPR